MSLRIDTEYYADSLVIGDTGLGVLAENIPSAGDSGGSFLFNDLTFPADTGKEIRAEILTTPSSGTFFAYEDGSFEFSGSPDGVYSFGYRLWVDGVDSGTASVSLIVGSIDAAASGALAEVSIVPPNGGGAGTTSVSGSAAGDLPPVTLTVPLGSATGSAGGGITLTPGDIDAIADAVWMRFNAGGLTTAGIAAAVGAHPVEGALTFDQIARILLAALAGKTAGIGGDTEQYFAQDGVTPRITVGFDASGNRTAMMLDGA